MSEPAGRCEVKVYQVDRGRVVVRVSGDMDAACHGAFRTTAAEALPAQLVVVDLSGCLFCDSQGLLELFQFEHVARTAGAEFRLAGVSPVVGRSLELCGANRYLAAFPTVDAALNA